MEKRSLMVEFWKDGKMISSYLTAPTEYSEDRVRQQEKREAARYLASHMCNGNVFSPMYRKLYLHYLNFFEVRVYDPDEVAEIIAYMREFGFEEA